MSKKRKQHTAEFKAIIGMEALRGIRTIIAIAKEYNVHSVQVGQWKKELKERSNEYPIRLKYVNSAEQLSIKRQCELLHVNRSTFYYKPCKESDFNLDIMLKIDQTLLECPEYESRMLADALSMEIGCDINRKRIQRLMRIMGVEAIYPKKRTTFLVNVSYIYPYLLRKLKINRPDQVLCTDITYLPMRGGYMYMVAVMD